MGFYSPKIQFPNHPFISRLVPRKDRCEKSDEHFMRTEQATRGVKATRGVERVSRVKQVESASSHAPYVP